MICNFCHGEVLWNHKLTHTVCQKCGRRDCQIPNYYIEADELDGDSEEFVRE